MSDKYWTGSTPSICQICYRNLVDKFIDGATVLGPWAMLCPTCHDVYGQGLGTGLGQLYRLTDKGWIKREG